MSEDMGKKEFFGPTRCLQTQRKIQEGGDSLRKGTYWAMGGILALLVGRGVGRMAAT